MFKELKVIFERDFIPISDMRLTAVKEAAKKDMEKSERLSAMGGQIK